MDSLRWNDVEVFLAVYRAGHLAGAGRALGVNATTVGRRLEAAEARLGAVLFTHTTDGYTVTAAGEAIVDAAELMDRQAHLIRERVSGEDARLEGTVRIALTDDFAHHFLVAHLGAFRLKYPGIELDLITSVGYADLARGEAEVAIRFAPPEKGVPARASVIEVRAQKLTTIGIALCASRAYLARRGRPSTTRELAGHDLVTHRVGVPWLPGSEWLRQHGREAEVAMRVDSMAAIAAALDAGFGIGALPCFIAHNVKLEILGPPVIIDSRDLWLLYPADLNRVARVRAVREFLIAVIKEWTPYLSGAFRVREEPTGHRCVPDEPT